MRNFVFGDIHGCSDEFQELLNKISPTSADQIILVGDIFDRGRGADVIWKLVHEHHIIAHLGNHERKYIQFLNGKRDSLPPHYYYAMNLLLQSGVNLRDFLDFLEKLPLVQRYQRGDINGTFIVAHAAVCLDDPMRPDVNTNVYGNLPKEKKMPIPKDDDGNIYFWNHYQQDELVLYGHLVARDGKPRIRYAPSGKINSIGLDTGTVHGGSLFAYCPEEDKFYGYKSGRDYFAELKAEFKIKPPVLNIDPTTIFDNAPEII